MGLAKSNITKLTNRLKKEGYEIKRSHGYKYSTAFVNKHGFYVYISANDDKNRFLIRTVKDEKDFSGGTNSFAEVSSSYKEAIKKVNEKLLESIKEFIDSNSLAVIDYPIISLTYDLGNMEDAERFKTKFDLATEKDQFKELNIQSLELSPDESAEEEWTIGNIDINLNDINNSVTGRLNTIEGNATVEGSIAKSLADAKAYTDTREQNITTTYEADAATLSIANVNIDTNVTALTNAYQNADTAIINSMSDINTTLTTNIATAQGGADEANAKIDAMATFTDANDNNITSTESFEGNVTAGTLKVKLTQAVDASNAKANDEALSQVEENQNKLQEEQKSGNLFIDFFNRLFGN
jgi:hypothetical protein